MLPELFWHPLTLSHQLPRSPPLLIRRVFTNSSYTVQVTDLTFVWGESLTRREIIQRALNEDTSIDPSEDASQMKIMLDKLKSALSLDEYPENEGDFGVQLSAQAAKVANMSTQPELQLKVACQLPSPLLPLAWTFKLRLLAQSELTKLLVLPLLNIASLHINEVTALLTVIKEKDLVIGKMKDALEETKVSLANIIGGGASRKRGLDTFDSEKWQNAMTQSVQSPGQSSVPNSVFGGTEKRKAGDGWDFKEEWEQAASRAEIAMTEFSDDWWKYLGEIGNEGRRFRGKKTFENEMDAEEDHPSAALKSSLAPTPKASRLSKRKEVSSFYTQDWSASVAQDDEDDFVVQRTPSPPVKPKQAKPTPPPVKKISKPTVDEEETTDDDDLDAPVVKRISGTPEASVIKKSLGKIGGKNEGFRPASLSTQRESSTESDKEDTVPAPVPKLGRFRGTVGGKVGGKVSAKVGGLKVAQEGISGVKVELPSRAFSNTPQVEEEKITSNPKEKSTDLTDDEADRKRRQLREALAAQQRAPAKKKRKF